MLDRTEALWDRSSISTTILMQRRVPLLYSKIYGGFGTNIDRCSCKQEYCNEDNWVHSDVWDNVDCDQLASLSLKELNLQAGTDLRRRLWRKLMNCRVTTYPSRRRHRCENVIGRSLWLDLSTATTILMTMRVRLDTLSNFSQLGEAREWSWTALFDSKPDSFLNTQKQQQTELKRKNAANSSVFPAKLDLSEPRAILVREP